jgi:hypothetical protein
MGSSFSVMRGTNTYYGIIEISYLMRNLAKNEYPQDLDAAMVEYTMGGEHGGDNNDSNMTFQDVADVGNTEKPMMVVEQGVNNDDNNMPQTPPASGAGTSSSPKSVPRPQTPPTSGAGAGTSSPKSDPRPQILRHQRQGKGQGHHHLLCHVQDHHLFLQQPRRQQQYTR